MTCSSCLCGGVRWRAQGPFQGMHHCHCGLCRKSHGAPFATYALCDDAAFAFEGAPEIAHWRASPALARAFCPTCGSVVPGDAVGGRRALPAGCFDDDPGVRPAAHIFVASRGPWYEVPDALPCFDAFPPGIESPELSASPAEEGEGAGGSCACRAIAWRILAVPTQAQNCHCTRCQKGRAAAHASNLFVASEELRFVRGADRVRSYKVPDARFFTVAFCEGCGGGVPRIDPARRIAVVPMGGLDDPPGVVPSRHIWVGSKAPWFEIADDLPQHSGSA